MHRPAMLMQPRFTSHWFSQTRAMPAVVTELCRSAGYAYAINSPPHGSFA